MNFRTSTLLGAATILLALASLPSLPVAAEGALKLTGPDGQTRVEVSQYGPTTAADTFWSIAQKTRPDTSVSVYQMMAAIFEANPHAFASDNYNSLERGMILAIPSKEMIQAIPVSLAKSRAEQDDRSWQALLRQQAQEVTPQQVLVAANNEAIEKAEQELEQVNESLMQAQTRNLNLTDELGRALDQLVVIKNDNDNLKLRISDLNDRVATLEQELITTREQNQGLRQKVEQLEWEASQAALPPEEPPFLTSPLGLGLISALVTLLLLIGLWLVLKRKSAQANQAPEANAAVAATAAASAVVATDALADDADELAVHLDEPDDSIDSLLDAGDVSLEPEADLSGDDTDMYVADDDPEPVPEPDDSQSLDDLWAEAMGEQEEGEAQRLDEDILEETVPDVADELDDGLEPLAEDMPFGADDDVDSLIADLESDLEEPSQPHEEAEEADVDELLAGLDEEQQAADAESEAFAGIEPDVADDTEALLAGLEQELPETQDAGDFDSYDELNAELDDALADIDAMGADDDSVDPDELFAGLSEEPQVESQPETLAEEEPELDELSAELDDALADIDAMGADDDSVDPDELLAGLSEEPQVESQPETQAEVEPERDELSAELDDALADIDAMGADDDSVDPDELLAGLSEEPQVESQPETQAEEEPERDELSAELDDALADIDAMGADDDSVDPDELLAGLSEEPQVESQPEAQSEAEPELDELSAELDDALADIDAMGAEDDSVGPDELLAGLSEKPQVESQPETLAEEEPELDELSAELDDALADIDAMGADDDSVDPDELLAGLSEEPQVESQPEAQAEEEPERDELNAELDDADELNSELDDALTEMALPDDEDISAEELLAGQSEEAQTDNQAEEELVADDAGLADADELNSELDDALTEMAFPDDEDISADELLAGLSEEAQADNQSEDEPVTDDTNPADADELNAELDDALTEMALPDDEDISADELLAGLSEEAQAGNQADNQLDNQAEGELVADAAELADADELNAELDDALTEMALPDDEDTSADELLAGLSEETSTEALTEEPDDTLAQSDQQASLDTDDADPMPEEDLAGLSESAVAASLAGAAIAAGASQANADQQSGTAEKAPQEQTESSDAVAQNAALDDVPEQIAETLVEDEQDLDVVMDPDAHSQTDDAAATEVQELDSMLAELEQDSESDAPKADFDAATEEPLAELEALQAADAYDQALDGDDPLAELDDVEGQTLTAADLDALDDDAGSKSSVVADVSPDEVMNMTSAERSEKALSEAMGRSELRAANRAEALARARDADESEFAVSEEELAQMASMAPSEPVAPQVDDVDSDDALSLDAHDAEMSLSDEELLAAFAESSEQDEEADFGVEDGTQILESGSNITVAEALAALDAQEQEEASAIKPSQFDEADLANFQKENGFIDIDRLLNEADESDEVDNYQGPSEVAMNDYRTVVGENTMVDVDDEENSVNAKLDLARAYIEIDDNDSARALLQEVAIDGNDRQQDEARSLMDKIG